MRVYERIILIVGLFLILIVGFWSHIPKNEIANEPIINNVSYENDYKDSYKVLISLLPIHRDSLPSGYNFFLLDKFANENEVEIQIEYKSRHHSSPFDSLYLSDYDLVVLPRGDSLITVVDSIVCLPLDSLCLWAMKSSEKVEEVERLQFFLDDWGKCEDYSQIRNSFFQARKSHCLSPYDDIIKEYSDSLRWDWRRMAAIIYCESNFHIEAHSRRGARGLMQLMPQTARNYGLKDVLNPRENIAAGYRLLKELNIIYNRYADNENEKFKLVLAAYNVGVGRMKDIISLAESMQVRTGIWDSLKTVIPQMNDSTTLDTTIVRFGLFNGQETIQYVDSVEDVYKTFCTIIE